ncbi:MAG TPA: sugar-binding transcriptional regulator [Casimicrobiaceae bacterium]|nr:sugar-binding transcriptional regulator [Casimicrobiaceae bacterium]
MEAREASLAIRAAWLYYVHGLTQAEVAGHLGLSRVKVHRLVARAHQQSWVKVFVEGSTAEGIALEQALKEQSKLQYCNVVPSDIESGEAVIGSLGAASALYLQQYLEQHPRCSIGIGHGRTLAALADALPRIPRPHVKFVSILGSLTRRSTANPFDVIYRLAERTGGEGYFVPAPLFVDSIEDAEVLRGQRMVKSVLDLAHRTDLILVGIGNLKNTPAIYAAERKALTAEGIVSEILGQFLDREGRVVNCDMAQRSISLRLDALRGRAVVAVAGGTDKRAAIDAALRSGLLSGLVTDEATARGILARPRRAS